MHKFKVQLYITFFLLLLLVACNHNSRQIKYNNRAGKKLYG